MKTIGKKVTAAVCAVVLGVGSALIATSMFGVVRVEGHTMAPAIRADAYTLVNKWIYLFHPPEEGDIVAFPCDVYSEDGEGRILVKRVVATQGDIVEIKDGALYINHRMYDKYAEKPVYMEPVAEMTIEDGKVFVLSDDRRAVLDSRDQSIGQLSNADIVGKVCF